MTTLFARISRLAGLSCVAGLAIFLMWHTFGYNKIDRQFLIASKVWSDFGAHIPLIRSFSQGPNLTRFVSGQAIESPLFPGEPIRYHFGFYLLIGILEKIGFAPDWALNLPSALGFFLLIVMIYLVSHELFANFWVSLLSVIFFLFNGSLAFLNFFNQHPLSPTIINDIITNSHFPAFGPWDGQEITAFWNLNIYTNQRHLALSCAIALLIIYLLLRIKKEPVKKKGSEGNILFWQLEDLRQIDHATKRNYSANLHLASLQRAAQKNVSTATLLFFLLLSLLFFNFPVFAIVGLFTAWFFVLKKETRWPLLLAGLALLPAWILLGRLSALPLVLNFHPGYLITPPLTITSFIRFWFLNLGLHTILIPLGIMFASKKIRLLLALPLLLSFIIPCLFQFSPDMINNHKFFNFFLIISNMFSAYFLTRLFSFSLKIIKVVTVIIFITVIFSGIIDFFSIVNDSRGRLPDIMVNEATGWIAKNTAPADIVLNSTWFYHPASLAGRAIFSGYPYFTWSYAYDKDRREQIARQIYAANDKLALCRLLRQNNIALVELSNRPEYIIPSQLWENLKPSYTNPQTGLQFYKVKTICGD